ncbi:MAG: hypothetical protein HY782_24670 [Chloroflexi bacterium]|nr:hypothetical protein [Chloroflexota bacterium]
MSTVYAAFCNNYSESRLYVIWDLKRDPNAPPVIFNGYLDSDQCTDWLPIYTGDDLWGKVLYQRSDGPQQIVDTITDSTTVRMD